MVFHNPHACRGTYDEALRPWLSLAQAQAAAQCLAGWPGLSAHPTPAWALQGLARAWGLGSLTVKDESRRSALGSFKALGAPHALVRLVQRLHPERGFDAADLLAGRHAAALGDLVVTSATDGNHGRALAAAAQSLGCRCVIVLHAQVSAEREAAIAALGAEIVRVAGDYDAAVREAARLAQAQGWQVVSDTSYPGYEAVPRDVMQGYGIIAAELLAQAAADTLLADCPERPDAPESPERPERPLCPWTHVLLQGGVGGLAAGVAAALWDHFGAQRPHFTVVEPAQADCLLQSALAGAPTRASGSVDSVMAGLACGEPSPLAWRFLQPVVDTFMTVSDPQAEAAMRLLAQPPHGDLPLVAGESAVAGLAGLQALLASPEQRAALGLDAQARVLVISTEGATAPGVYAQIVGEPAAAVQARHQAWLQAQGIAQDRLLHRLHQHARIGATAAGGVCRLAFSAADRDGRDQLRAWMQALGLQVQVDQIGNLFGTRPGRRSGPGPEAAPVMTGSHIDTVATGGRYDGMLGVMAGLEVVHWLNQRGISTERPLVVAAFSNEEGVRYAPDMMGSLVHAGGLPLQQALNSRASDGSRLGDELARIGYAGSLPCGSIRPHAFIELHIEQGPVMAAEGWQIGAVHQLQGIRWLSVQVRGQSNHAGTTPMHLRHDAGHAAAAIAVFVRQLARRVGPPMVATVGSLVLQPNLVNVIAHSARLTVDLRHTDEATLQQAEAELAAHLRQLAAEEGVQIDTEDLVRCEPVRFDEALVQRIEAAARARGLRVGRITSGAGHDAQMLARMAPSAMVFVPSEGGLSHNPREHTAPQDLKHGADVLLDVLLGLAGVAEPA